MGFGDVRPGRADGGKLVARWRLRLPYFLEIRNLANSQIQKCVFLEFANSRDCVIRQTGR